MSHTVLLQWVSRGTSLGLPWVSSVSMDLSWDSHTPMGTPMGLPWVLHWFIVLAHGTPRGLPWDSQSAARAGRNFSKAGEDSMQLAYYSNSRNRYDVGLFTAGSSITNGCCGGFVSVRAELSGTSRQLASSLLTPQRKPHPQQHVIRWDTWLS